MFVLQTRSTVYRSRIFGAKTWDVVVAVNFFLQLNFILPFFLGMVIYDNEFKTKEK